MTATNPIEINGKSYDKFSLNLAITGRYLGDGSSDANVAMRLVPTRIEDGVVETADEAAIGILRGSFSEIADPAEQVAVAAIQSALQTLISTKGL